jgi:hypothetical protein
MFDMNSRKWIKQQGRKKKGNLLLVVYPVIRVHSFTYAEELNSKSLLPEGCW